jgi:hypothetical protein
MTTNIANIPMKTNLNEIPQDDSDDPMVKDILNEFQQEMNNQEVIKENAPVYVINNPIEPIKTQKIINKSNNYYNEEFVKKSAIIIVIIAFIFSPVIFSSIIDKLPLNLSVLLEDYNYYIKLIFAFIAIYLMFNYNLL